MHWNRLAAASSAALALLVSPAARAADHHAAKAAAPKAAQVVQVVISDDGVQPATISARAGQPVKLVFTRKTDSTCIKEVVLKDFGITKPLPLNQPVAIEVTPAKAGTYPVVCGMGMAVTDLKVN